MRERERQRGPAHRYVGFTLFEVMITVAVIAILAAVALPSYLQYVTRANRAAAEGFMLEVANRQERFLLDNRGYASSIATLTGAGLIIPPSVSANYTVTTTSGSNPPSYQVKASPIGAQATRDAACGDLTLDELGVKGVSGTAGRAACWRD